MNWQIKSTALPCFFVCALDVGASAPNPDTRNFSRKVSWNFKSFAKINWSVLCESSLAYLSFKKGKFFCPLFFERKVGYGAIFIYFNISEEISPTAIPASVPLIARIIM